MENIRVMAIIRPKPGKYIAEGNYGYTKSEDGSPAMAFRWHGTFLLGNWDLFLFAKQSERFGVLDHEAVNLMARTLKKPLPLGLLPSLAVEIGGAVRSKILAKGTKAFGVLYRNPEGHTGNFFAIAPSDIVDEIVAVIPPDKLKLGGQAGTE